MPTRITSAWAPGVLDEFEGDAQGRSNQVDVREPFERVLNLPIPLQQPASSLEARQALTLTTTDGRSVWVAPQSIVMLEELA